MATDRYTYFTLETSDWRVASEHASVVKRVGPTKTLKNGQVWGVAPIEYVGAVGRCRTKYPLFAACADPWFNKANCGWDTPNHNYGSLTYMRLLSAGSNMEGYDKKRFWGEWVPNPYDPSQKVKLHHENLFEYDSVSYDDAALIVAEKQEEYADAVMAYVLAWFKITLPILLCVRVWLICGDPLFVLRHQQRPLLHRSFRRLRHRALCSPLLPYTPPPVTARSL